MDIRSSLEGLKSLLGTTPAAPATTPQQPRSGAAVSGSAFSSDRATLSSAGSEVAMTATDSDVRTDKVAGIQSALAAGTYNVSASAVATKVVNSMLGGE
jgi:negative regulator of flagellin synthesis FlgM